MIDDNLKNELLEMYKDIYRSTVTSDNTPWVRYGELIGVSNVLSKLEMVDDMCNAQAEVWAGLEESL